MSVYSLHLYLMEIYQRKKDYDGFNSMIVNFKSCAGNIASSKNIYINCTDLSQNIVTIHRTCFCVSESNVSTFMFKNIYFEVNFVFLKWKMEGDWSCHK